MNTTEVDIFVSELDGFDENEAVADSIVSRYQRSLLWSEQNNFALEGSSVSKRTDGLLDIALEEENSSSLLAVCSLLQTQWSPFQEIQLSGNSKIWRTNRFSALIQSDGWKFAVSALEADCEFSMARIEERAAYLKFVRDLARNAWFLYAELRNGNPNSSDAEMSDLFDRAISEIIDRETFSIVDTDDVAMKQSLHRISRSFSTTYGFLYPAANSVNLEIRQSAYKYWQEHTDILFQYLSWRSSQWTFSAAIETQFFYVRFPAQHFSESIDLGSIDYSSHAAIPEIEAAFLALESTKKAVDEVNERRRLLGGQDRMSLDELGRMASIIGILDQYEIERKIRMRALARSIRDIDDAILTSSLTVGFPLENVRNIVIWAPESLEIVRSNDVQSWVSAGQDLAVVRPTLRRNGMLRIPIDQWSALSRNIFATGLNLSVRPTENFKLVAENLASEAAKFCDIQNYDLILSSYEKFLASTNKAVKIKVVPKNLQTIQRVEGHFEVQVEFQSEPLVGTSILPCNMGISRINQEGIYFVNFSFPLPEGVWVKLSSQ